MKRRLILAFLFFILSAVLSGCIQLAADEYELLSELSLAPNQTDNQLAEITVEASAGGTCNISGWYIYVYNADPPDEGYAQSSSLWGENPVNLGLDPSSLSGKEIKLAYDGYNQSNPDFVYRSVPLTNLSALEPGYSAEEFAEALQADIDNAFPNPDEMTFTVSLIESEGNKYLKITSHPKVTVTANPEPGFEFLNWTELGDPETVVSTDPVYTFEVTGDRALRANFVPATDLITITVSANPAGGGTVSGGGTCSSGDPVTVTATAAEGYDFVNWTENGVEVSPEAEYTFTATADRTLVANFVESGTATEYLITVSSNPAGGGTVSGGGTYASGSAVTVKAKAATATTLCTGPKTVLW